MKFQVTPKLRAVLMLTMIIGLAVFVFVGCTSDQLQRVENGAAQVQAGTTQPIAQAVGATFPIAGQVIAGIGGIAAIVAGIANNLRKQRDASQAALKEVASDIASFKEDDVPFSPTTAAELSKQGLGHLTTTTSKSG